MEEAEMGRAARYLRVGIALTAAALIVATVVSLILGMDWSLVAMTTLGLAGVGLMAMGRSAEHPPTWGGGSWSIYVEMSARESAGGGPSGMARPSSTWDGQAVVNGLLPIVVAGVLLVARFLL
jgi:hypothetical protein